MSREVGIPSIPLEPPHCCFGHERDFQPSGMSKREPKQEVTAMVPVTNARFNHRECPSVRARKKSPQWFRSRTRRSSIGNVQACEHARNHHNDFGHERDLLPSRMSKRERAQEVTTMISSRIGATHPKATTGRDHLRMTMIKPQWKAGGLTAPITRYGTCSRAT